jgi:phage-related protein
MAWKIVFYESPSGKLLVQKFISSLSVIPQAKLLRKIDLHEEFGVRLSMPHARGMGSGLFELRVRSKTDVRVTPP